MDNQYRPLQIIHSFEGLANGTEGIEVMAYGRSKPTEPGNFEERVRVQLEKLAERGVGGIVVNTGYDGYLENEEGWKRFITGLEIAVGLNLRIWIYDENGYPSGFAGGLVLKGHPELEAVGIKRIIVKNPRVPLAIPLPESEARLFALFGISNGNRVKIPVKKWASEVNLKTGSYDSLEIYFVAPLRAGTAVAYPGNTCSQYINVLDRRAVRRFVSLTHLRYFKEVPARLWKHIEAIFTDEPALLAYYFMMDKGVPLYPAMPWCEELEEVFYKNNGHFVEDQIYSLFEGMSGEDKKTRRQFWQTVAEIYERSFSQISDLCSAINIDLTGHLFEEDMLYRNAVAQGNPINLLKHFQRPGIDILTSNPEWLAIFTFGLKMVLSAAMFGGKKGLMTEVSEYCEYWTPERRKKLDGTGEYWTGDRNANSIEEIKHAIAFLFLFGVRDYAFYYTWRNFTAAEYRELTDFTARLCSCGKESIYRPDYALYYPIERMWEEYLPSEKDWRYEGFESQSESLKKINAVMSTYLPGTTDVCKELFFSNVQYILCDRSNLYNLVKMKIKKLLFPPIGEPAQELADLCRTAGIELIRLDGPGAESLKAKQPGPEPHRNLQTGAKVVYACYDRFIFVLNTSKEPSFAEISGDYEALFPSRNDKKIKVSGRIELNPLESLFLFS